MRDFHILKIAVNDHLKEMEKNMILYLQRM